MEHLPDRQAADHADFQSRQGVAGGRAAPGNTNDLYFVADGTGGSVFAATYEEHMANVAHWRQVEGDVEHYVTSADTAEDAGVNAADTVQPQPQSDTQPAKTPTAGVRLKGVVH